jgi:adenylate cyclase, class 2
MILNIEIKARTKRAAAIRQLLQAHQADFRGTDHQIDSYFRVPDGRLKLREGNIENSLIFYRRPDQEGPKASEIHLYRPEIADPALKEVLVAALGVWKVVDKQRDIFFIDNVKFHLDQVAGLGEFVEIEAIDTDGSIGEVRLREQCAHYQQLFDIQEEDLIEHSYSDMVGGSDS